MCRVIAVFGLSIVFAVASGCSTMAKRAFKEVVGATSKSAEVPGTMADDDFSRFKSVNIGEPHSELGGLVSAPFRQVLPVALRKYLIEEEDAPFKGGAPRLEIDPEIMWYHDASGGMGGLFGSDSFVVVLYGFSENGNSLGKLQLVTKNAATREGEADLAESMAKALAEWFVDRREAAK